MVPAVLAGPTRLLESVGPWLLGAAAAFSTLLLLRVLLDLKGSGREPVRRLRPRTAEKALFYVILALHWAAFGLLVWYHYRIWRDLPLELPPRIVDWVNNRFRLMGGVFPAVSAADPPRYALPLWIEGEKFFFWSLVYCSALVFPFLRRTETAFRAALYGFLNVYLWGVFFFARPFTEPLARFWSEVGPWFGANVYLKADLFANRIYPRMIFFYNAHYMWIHPPLLFAAYALLTVTFTACVFMLFSARREHERQAYGFAKVGYILLTFGMLIGYPWALQAWGPNWWWDPKIASSIMMWLLYSAYLHTRLYTHRRALWFTSAGLGMLCWVSLVFTYFMAWFFPGEHTF